MASSRWLFFKRRQLLRPGVASAAVLLLAACSAAPAAQPGQPDTSVSPAASAAPTPTPTASASPKYRPADAKGPARNVPLPVKPPLADEKSKQGLEAFARYWYGLLSYAYESGDTSPWEKLTSQKCSKCAQAGTTIKGWHKEGRWIAGGRIAVQKIALKFAQNRAGEYQAIVTFNQGSLDFYLSNGKKYNSVAEAKTSHEDLLVTKATPVGWEVQRVEPVG